MSELLGQENGWTWKITSVMWTSVEIAVASEQALVGERQYRDTVQAERDRVLGRAAAS